MPIEAAPNEGQKPTEPHFALLMDESGLRVAIPPGASLWIVEDASRQDRIFPLTVKKVSHEKLTFLMQDEKGALTEYVYRLTSAKPLSRQALMRLRGNNPQARSQK